MKRKIIIGLNASGFNTSACLFVDGILVFAAEEERFNREKRTRKFPTKALDYIFKKYKLTIKDVDFFTVGWNPAINLENPNTSQNQGQTRFLGELFYNVANSLVNYNNEVGDFTEQIVHYKKKKIHIYFIRHHISHASLFFLSGLKKSAVLTLDAFGEKQSSEFFDARENSLKSLWNQEFPHSMGSFYSTFTSFLGFKPQSDEWKLMGASAYGNHKRFEKKIKNIIYPTDHGFELDLTYFNHFQFHRPGYYSKKLSNYLGIDPLNKNEELNEIHYDLAASVQKSFEDICFHLLKKLYEKTNCTSLVFSGGCAYNCSLNGKIDQNTNFNNVFIPPFPDDSGVSIGSALYLNKVILKNKKNFVLNHNYLGPNYDNSEIKFLLNSFKIKNRFIKNPEEDAAKEIESGKIIGWFQGKLEFGDRSLGNRSILADPRDKKMKDKVNNLIKYRESFRPFAPSILEEHVGNFFKSKIISPFMSKTKEVKKNKQNLIPAVVHHDGSARLQSVSQINNPRFYKLLKYFFRNTGVPMLLNTSFNVQGEPIVCSPQDALRTFFSCGLDILYLENFKIEKK